MKTKTINIRNCYLLIISILIFSSCKKFLEIDLPTTQITNEAVLSDDPSATSAIRGIYSTMLTSGGFASGSNGSISLLCGLSADELINYSVTTEQSEFYSNNLLPTNNMLKTFIWQEAYKYIYYSNSILESIESSSGVTPATKDQIRGEALFVRAFSNFYLTSLFGEVPVILTTDYRINSNIKSVSRKLVFSQIINDLKLAKTLLKDDYSFSNGERVRPNRWAAIALLARAYLYDSDWSNAESESSIIINSGKFILTSNLNETFLKNNTEAIWQLIGNSTTKTTAEGQLFILTTTPNNIALENDLVKAFEKGDKRRSNWIDSVSIGSNKYYYPFKYKLRTFTTPLQEYSTILRYAEQFLIRAEARIMLNKIADGIEDLNVIRTRARRAVTDIIPNPLPNLALNLAKPDALLAVEKERRLELFSEWGHRWLDLKRTGRADEIFGIKKAPNWQPADVNYPIPESEILLNPNIKNN